MSNMKTGIYEIYCIESNKRYIGQAVHIHKRWTGHRVDLRKSRHKNKHLQLAWNMYGEEQFLFRIVEECTKEQLNERETYWITHYNSIDKSKGYNYIKEFTDGIIEEQINKRVQSRNEKGKVIRNYTPVYRRIVSVNTETGVITEYSSFKEVTLALNASENSVQNCLSCWSGNTPYKNTWAIKGNVLIYRDLYNPETDYVDEYNNKQLQARIVIGLKQKGIKKNIKIQYQREGVPIRAINISTKEVREFSNKGIMARELNLAKSSINQCLSDKYTNIQHKGWRFERIIAN